MPRGLDLMTILNTQLTQQQNNAVEQPTDNGTTLNYQFMYKQLESAVEEILIKYPNDDIVIELKQNLVRNLKPILEQLQNGMNDNG